MYVFLFLGLIAFSTTQEQSTTEPKCDCSQLLNAEEPYQPIPLTSFACWGRFDGYYADVEVDCTIFHYCQTWHFPNGVNETVKWDFACPESTIFNQRILSCTPPSFSFDCKESSNYYWVNYNLTITPPPGFTPTSGPDSSSESTPDEEPTTENIKYKLVEIPASPQPMQQGADHLASPRSIASPTPNPDFEKPVSPPLV